MDISFTKAQKTSQTIDELFRRISQQKNENENEMIISQINSEILSLQSQLKTLETQSSREIVAHKRQIARE